MNRWFKSFHKAVEMCGPNADERRIITKMKQNILIN